MSWKLSRTVLRGAVGGNADCLLDPKEGKPPKQPYAFELANGSLMGFAGLWDAWKDAQGHWLQSFAIVTTEANELMASIHPHMPVILHSQLKESKTSYVRKESELFRLIVAKWRE